jgi:DNA-binding IclR family transcriptional regulator
MMAGHIPTAALRILLARMSPASVNAALHKNALTAIMEKTIRRQEQLKQQG